jgi:hypothetical protein
MVSAGESMTAARIASPPPYFPSSLGCNRTLLMRRMPECLLLFLLVWTAPAWADDPSFPPGSRVGLVPPSGFSMSKTFSGFMDPEKNALILITELPASAYGDLDERVADEQLRRQGVTVERREPMTLATGPGFLVTGHQEAGGVMFRRWILFGSTRDFTAIVSVQVPDAVKETYPDPTMRAALETLAVRATAPVEEQLEGLPFTLRELAGFRLVRVIGSAALLTDGPATTLELAEQPLLLIAAAPGAVATQPGDRDRFARGVLAETPGVKDIRVVRSEPLRIGGQQGHEILAEAKDVKTDGDVMIAQWLRFGASGHLRVLGMARKEGWAEVFTRLRAVRDGIDLR